MKKGFTYIEVMMAIAVFLIMAICVMKLNIEANKNIIRQVDKQDMMMEAQKQMEIFKTTTKNIGKYIADNSQDNEYKLKDDYYYIIVQSSNDEQLNDSNLLKVTVRVRKNLKNDDNEVILISHFYKN